MFGLDGFCFVKKKISEQTPKASYFLSEEDMGPRAGCM